jgi:malate dehydrogenase
MCDHMTSLSVMGVGRVGGEVAFLTAAMGLADTFVLDDVNSALLLAQTLDLQHTGLDITISTDAGEMKSSDIFIFSAGTPRNPHIKTRADLLEANIPIANACSRFIGGFEGILITITNPMDANNYQLSTRCHLERHRCIGFGGQLDSARFGGFLKERGIAGEAMVMGEHGEHQVPLFSRLPVQVDEGTRNQILSQMRGASMDVIKGKGGTMFGPAYHIVSLIRAIVEDARSVLPCSCVLEGEYGIDECSLGVPARIGRNGIQDILEYELDPWEDARFREAAEFMKGLCRRAHDRV